MDASSFRPRRRGPRWRGPLRALCGLACLLATAQQSAAQPESGVKAAFVFNFIRFTEWPPVRVASRDAPLSLCVWSTDGQLAESMRSLGGRLVDQHPLRVVDIERADDLGRCQVLFVSETAPRGALSGWLRRSESLDVLTVGDGDSFAAGGGMIGLNFDGTKMRFDINDKAVRRSNIKFGSQLYQLGRSVTEGNFR